MNYRYLYRAKRISPLELPKEKSWIEGYYAYMKPFHYIMPKGSFDSWYRIDEKTLCQCTGLKDKNGKLIFEKDIVEMYDRNTDYKWRAVVLFGNPNCEYTWGWQLNPIGECEENTDILCWIDMEESGAFCEVIGSAIDNQEPLEVGE